MAENNWWDKYITPEGGAQTGEQTAQPKQAEGNWWDKYVSPQTQEQPQGQNVVKEYEDAVKGYNESSALAQSSMAKFRELDQSPEKTPEQEQEWRSSWKTALESDAAATGKIEAAQKLRPAYEKFFADQDKSQFDAIEKLRENPAFLPSDVDSLHTMRDKFKKDLAAINEGDEPEDVRRQKKMQVSDEYNKSRTELIKGKMDESKKREDVIRDVADAFRFGEKEEKKTSELRRIETSAKLATAPLTAGASLFAPSLLPATKEVGAVADENVRQILRNVPEGLRQPLIDDAQNFNALLENKKDAAIVNNELRISPAIVMDDERANAAIKASGASEEQQRAMRNNLPVLQANQAKEELPIFEQYGVFNNFIKEKGLENASATEKVKAFKNNDINWFKKLPMQIGNGIVAGYAGLIRQMQGLMGSTVNLYAGATGSASAGEMASNFAMAASDQGRELDELNRISAAMGGPQLASTFANTITQMVPLIATGSGVWLAARVGMLGRAAMTAKRASDLGFYSSAGMEGLQAFSATYADATDALYQKFKDGGMDDKSAMDLAMRQAYTPAILTGISTTAVTLAGGKTGVDAIYALMDDTDFKGATRTFLKDVFKDARNEAIEEFSQQMLQDAAGKLTYNPDMTLQEAIEDSLMAGLLGGVMGGTMGAGTYGVETFGARRAMAARADSLGRIHSNINKLEAWLEQASAVAKTPDFKPAEAFAPSDKAKANGATDVDKAKVDELRDKRAKLSKMLEDESLSSVTRNEIETELTQASRDYERLLQNGARNLLTEVASKKLDEYVGPDKDAYTGILKLANGTTFDNLTEAERAATEKMVKVEKDGSVTFEDSAKEALKSGNMFEILRLISSEEVKKETAQSQQQADQQIDAEAAKNAAQQSVNGAAPVAPESAAALQAAIDSMPEGPAKQAAKDKLAQVQKLRADAEAKKAAALAKLAGKPATQLAATAAEAPARPAGPIVPPRAPIAPVSGVRKPVPPVPPRKPAPPRPPTMDKVEAASRAKNPDVPFREISEGHAKFSDALDRLVKGGVLTEDRADILRSLFRDSEPETMAMASDMEAKKTLVEGTTALTRINKEGTRAWMQFKKGLAEEAELGKVQDDFWKSAVAEPIIIFSHEYGHFGYWTILNQKERDQIYKVYKRMEKEGRIKEFTKGGMAQTNRMVEYFASNEREFFAQAFAEYVATQKVPDAAMRPILERCLEKFVRAWDRAMRRIEGRAETVEVKSLQPLFEKVIKGSKNPRVPKLVQDAKTGRWKGVVRKTTGEGPELVDAMAAANLSAGKAKALGVENDLTTLHLMGVMPEKFAGVGNATQLKARVSEVLEGLRSDIKEGKFNNTAINKKPYEAQLGRELTQGEYDKMLADMHEKQNRIYGGWADYLENGGYTPEVQSLILNAITKEVALPKPDGGWSFASLGKNADRLPDPASPELAAFVAREVARPENKSKRIAQIIAEGSAAAEQSRRAQKEQVAAETETGDSITWVRFPSQSEDPDNFDRNVQDLTSLAKTSSKFGKCDWCTGNGAAAGQLQMGDFWVGVDPNGNARVAVRMEGEDQIAEVRGILEGQDLETSMAPAVVGLFEEKGWEGGEWIDEAKMKTELSESISNATTVEEAISGVRDIVKKYGYNETYVETEPPEGVMRLPKIESKTAYGGANIQLRGIEKFVIGKKVAVRNLEDTPKGAIPWLVGHENIYEDGDYSSSAFHKVHVHGAIATFDVVENLLSSGSSVVTVKKVRYYANSNDSSTINVVTVDGNASSYDSSTINVKAVGDNASSYGTSTINVETVERNAYSEGTSTINVKTVEINAYSEGSSTINVETVEGNANSGGTSTINVETVGSDANSNDSSTINVKTVERNAYSEGSSTINVETIDGNAASYDSSTINAQTIGLGAESWHESTINAQTINGTVTENNFSTIKKGPSFDIGALQENLKNTKGIAERVRAAIEAGKTGAESPELREGMVPREARREPATKQDADYLAAVEGGDYKTAQRILDSVFPPLPEMSQGLKDEMSYRLNASNESGNVTPSWFALKELIGSWGDRNSAASEFKKELQDIGISIGYYEPITIEEANRRASNIWTSSGRRSKGYEFKRGDNYYTIAEGTPLDIQPSDTRDDADNIIPLSQRFHPEESDIRYAKTGTPSPIENIFDAREGIGQVPFNVEIGYRGFVKYMTPSEFRSLVPAGVSGQETKQFVVDALRSGEKLGQPFLNVTWNDADGVWEVTDHEGRSRVDAILEVYGNVPIPVHMFPSGLRAADITVQMRNAPFVSQSDLKSWRKKETKQSVDPIAIQTQQEIRALRMPTMGRAGMEQAAVEARLQELGFPSGGILRVVNEPDADFEGRTIIVDGKVTGIELNSAAMRDNATIDRVLNHEFAESANADGALNRLVKNLTPKEKKEINDTITRLRYAEKARTSEEAARAIEALAEAWKGRGFFTRAVARIEAWANKLGFKLTRRAAEYIAARNLADINSGFRAAYNRFINVKGEAREGRAFVTPEENARFLELAKDPEANREELQRMVDEKARSSGYVFGPVWHGVRSGKKFTRFFDQPTYFSESESFATNVVAGKQGRVIKAFLRGKLFDPRNPDHRAQVKGMEEFYGRLPENPTYHYFNTAVQNWLKEHGWDGHFEQESRDSKERSLVVFDPMANAKSAEPVTYDDNGNVIPLEQRFQPTTPDIRYARRDYQADADSYKINDLSKIRKILNISNIEDGIVKFLSRDLLDAKWAKIPVANDATTHGHCWVAAEAAYHILGGKGKGWEHRTLNNKGWPEGLDAGETHHFIQNKKTGEIIDPTRSQFGNVTIPYENSIFGGAFMGKTAESPSIRAKALLHRIATGEARGEVRESRVDELVEPMVPREEAVRADKEYMDAVERGDMESAQRMVDDAAKDAGYDSPEVFHGSIEKGIKSFDINKAVEVEGAIFFTTNEDVAAQYTFERAYGDIISEEPLGDVTSAKLRMTNPFEYSAKGKIVDAVEMQRVVNKAKSDGYDGVIIRNIDDSVGMTGDMGDVYVVFNSNQIKSTDPVTYDSNGNVIPLSERFNPKSDLIDRMAAGKKLAFDPEEYFEPAAEGTPEGDAMGAFEDAFSQDEKTGESTVSLRQITNAWMRSGKDPNALADAIVTHTSMEPEAAQTFAEAVKTQLDYEAALTELREGMAKPSGKKVSDLEWKEAPSKFAPKLQAISPKIIEVEKFHTVMKDDISEAQVRELIKDADISDLIQMVTNLNNDIHSATRVRLAWVVSKKLKNMIREVKASGDEALYNAWLDRHIDYTQWFNEHISEMGAGLRAISMLADLGADGIVRKVQRDAKKAASKYYNKYRDAITSIKDAMALGDKRAFDDAMGKSKDAANKAAKAGAEREAKAATFTDHARKLMAGLAERAAGVEKPKRPVNPLTELVRAHERRFNKNFVAEAVNLGVDEDVAKQIDELAKQLRDKRIREAGEKRGAAAMAAVREWEANQPEHLKIKRLMATKGLVLEREISSPYDEYVDAFAKLLAKKLMKDPKVKVPANIQIFAERMTENLLGFMPKEARAKAKPKDYAKFIVEAFSEEPVRDAEGNVVMRRQTHYEDAVRMALVDISEKADAVRKTIEQGGEVSERELSAIGAEAFMKQLADDVADFPVSPELVNKFMRQKAGDLNLSLASAYADWYKAGPKKRGSLAYEFSLAMVENLNIPQEAADELAKRIEESFVEKAQEARKKVIERYKAREKTFGPKVVPSRLKKFLEANNIGLVTDEDAYAIIAPKFGLPEQFDQEFVKELHKIATAIDDEAEGSAKRIALTTQMMRMIAQQKGYSLADLGMAAAFFNTLSSPDTFNQNAADTAMNIFVEGVIGAAATGNFARMMGNIKALKRGWEAFKEVWMTGERIHAPGFEAAEPQLLEYTEFGKKGGVHLRGFGSTFIKAILESKPARILNAAKFLNRSLEATDALNMAVSKRGHEYAEAMAQAKAEGIKGSAKQWARVNEILNLSDKAYQDALLKAKQEGLTGAAAQLRAFEIQDKDIPEDIKTRSMERGLKDVYRSKPKGYSGALAVFLSDAINRIKNPWLKAAVKVNTSLFIVTPTNVFNRWLNYTPYGYVRLFAGRGWGTEKFAVEAPKFRTEEWYAQMWKANSSILALALVDTMIRAGIMSISGKGPSDPEKRKWWRGENHKPYSIRLGNGPELSFAWTPWALLLGVYANAQDRLKYDTSDKDDVMKRYALAMYQIPYILQQMPFFQSVGNLYEIADPKSNASLRKRADTFIGDKVRMMLPNALNYLDRIFDPREYKTEDISGMLLDKIPFARRLGEPAVNLFGRPIGEDVEPWEQLIKRFVSVPKPSRESQILVKYDIFPYIPDNSDMYVAVGNGRAPMNPAQRAEWQKILGQQVTPFLNKNFKPDGTITEAQRKAGAKIISNFYENARSYATRKVSSMGSLMTPEQREMLKKPYKAK